MDVRKSVNYTLINAVVVSYSGLVSYYYIPSTVQINFTQVFLANSPFVSKSNQRCRNTNIHAFIHSYFCKTESKYDYTVWEIDKWQGSLFLKLSWCLEGKWHRFFQWYKRPKCFILINSILNFIILGLIMVSSSTPYLSYLLTWLNACYILNSLRPHFLDFLLSFPFKWSFKYPP